MTRLAHKLTNDILFKMLFTQYQDLLKKLVAELLGIQYKDITEFKVTSPELTPEFVGEKFCKIDINMVVNGQKVNLEVQVNDEGNFPERSLFYWARMFSSALEEGGKYAALPRTITINIIDFFLFDCDEFHSEFEILEVKRRERLTDKFVKHFFELKKLPPLEEIDNGRDLWLKLFKAETEEELAKIASLEVDVLSEAVAAYRQVSTSPEFKEYERIRTKARHDEAQALHNRDLHWQGIVADKDAAIANKDAAIADRDARIADLEAQLKKRQ